MSLLNPQPNMDLDELEFAVGNDSKVHEVSIEFILPSTSKTLGMRYGL